jgi:alanyl-tRNA synthetase
MGVVTRRFESFGFPLVIDSGVIPDDDSTLFLCSGMQRIRHRFYEPDGGKYGSLQSCIRTNDLDLVGDGSHLSHFKMLGNFSFGGPPYEVCVELWHAILTDLNVPVSTVHCHPGRPDHFPLWEQRGYRVVPDDECVWSDGRIGGHCCEVYVGDVEVGNLVNTLGHSTDVGFGWERLLQVVEGKQRVEQTSLFRQNCHPVVADHERTLDVLRQNGVRPGNKGREYVCRRLLRRLLRHRSGEEHFPFQDWVEEEVRLQARRLRGGRRAWRRNQDRPPSWWWETFGILPEEISLLGGDPGRGS